MAGKKVVYLSDVHYGTRFPREKLSKQGEVVQIACAKTPLGLLELYRFNYYYVFVVLNGIVVGKEMYAVMGWAIENAYRYLRHNFDEDMVWKSLKLLTYAISDHECLDYRTYPYYNQL